MWLTEDIKGVKVLGRGADGSLTYGTATLRAGSTVWYDANYNDKTMKPTEDTP